MAQKMAHINFLKSKIDFVKAQRDEFHSVLCDFIHKETSLALEIAEDEEQDMATVQGMDSRMDALLDFLVKKTSEVKGYGNGSTPESSGSQSMLSLTQPGHDPVDISRLCHRLETLEMAMATCRKEVIKCTSNSTEAKQEVEKFKTKLESIEAVVSDSERKESVKYDALEEKVTNLMAEADKQKLTTGSMETQIKDMESSVKMQESTRKKLEKRMSQVEALRKKDLDHYIKKLNEVDSSYKQVCQIVDNRVTPLRRLQYLLNEYHKKVEKREDLASRLDKLTDRVGEMSSRMGEIDDSVSAIATSPPRTPCGFTAHFEVGERSGNVSIIQRFTDILTNEGGHYDPATGQFTAPWDGLYVASLTIRMVEARLINIQVQHQKSAASSAATSADIFVCGVRTSEEKNTSNAVSLVKMKAGDKLLLKLFRDGGAGPLSNYSSFSCFFIC